MSSPTTAHSSNEPNGVGALLRRGWIALSISMIVGLVAGVILTNLEQPKYTASASVLVTPTGVSDSTSLANSRTSGTINLDTEAQLARSTQVAERVQTLDPARKAVPPQALLANLAITVPPNTQVLRLSYTAASATTASEVANDFATAYLAVRGDTAQNALDAQTKKIAENLKALNKTLASVIGTLTGLHDDQKNKQIYNSRKTQLQAQISALNSQASSLSSSVVTPGSLISQATVPGQPSSPSLLLNVAAGISGGLIIGLLVAWFRFAKRRRMSRPDDVTRLIHLPIAGAVGQIHSGAVEPANSAAAGQYQRLVNLLIASVGHEGVVLITGAAGDSPSDTVAANVAAALSRSAVSVSLLSLTGRMDQVTTDSAPAVHVVDRDTSLTMASAITRAKLDQLRRGGVVIVTTDAPGESADAQTLASLSDAVLVVVAARTRVRDGRSAVNQLDAVGSPVLGAVLVPGERSSRPAVLAPIGAAGKSGGSRHKLPAITSGQRADLGVENRAPGKPAARPGLSSARRPAAPSAHGSNPTTNASGAVAHNGAAANGAGNRSGAGDKVGSVGTVGSGNGAAARPTPTASHPAPAGNGATHPEPTGHRIQRPAGAAAAPASAADQRDPSPAAATRPGEHHPTHPDSDTLATEAVSVSALVRSRSRAKFDRSSRR